VLLSGILVVPALFRIRSLVLFLGLAVCGFGQPGMFPQLIKMGAVVGSTSPITEAVNLTVAGFTGPVLDYDITVLYGTGPQGWLSVTPSHGQTPARPTISADPTNLPAGTYSAQVQASVGPLKLGTYSLITFIVAPSSSNPGGVGATPGGLTFLAPNLAPQTISVTNAPGGTGSLGFTVFANPSDWLMVVSSDQATPATVTVQVSPGLSPGPHVGSVTLTASNGKSTVVPVTVNAAASGTTSLIPAQRALVFNYSPNTSLPFLLTQTLQVSTDSLQTVNFTATASDSWILVPPGSFPAPSSQGLNVFVNISDPSVSAPGTYKGSITLTAQSLAPVVVPVTLTVATGQVLNANPSYVSLPDPFSGSLTALVTVTTSSNFVYTATVSQPWLSATISSSDPTSLTITANPAGLTPGTYNGSVTISGPPGTLPITVPVQLQANIGSAGTPLLVSPASLSFVGIGGTTIPPQYLVISSSAIGTEQITISAVSDSGWLSVDNASGMTPVTVKASVSNTLAPGSYAGSIVVTSLQSGNSTTVPVTFKLAARVLSVSPSGLVFTQPDVNSRLAPQDVHVTSNAPSTFRFVHQPTWIKISGPASFTTPATFTATVDLTGLTPGQYQDSIQLSGPNDVTIPVVLSLAAPSPPTATPAAINLSYETGSPAPAPQSIRLGTPSGTVAFTATASTSSGLNWLLVSPASGLAPLTVLVNVDPTLVVPGQQTGTVLITFQDPASTTVRIPVTLTVTGTAVQVRDILNSATGTPASLAPGELVTLTGFGLGPVASVSARPTQAGAYATTLGGTSVTFDGTAAPLLFVRNDQINAVVPYSVFGRVSSKVQVQSGSSFSIPIDFKVVDAAPGIFTIGTTGRGPALALNADSTQNSVLNPAPRGTVIVFYLTGEGQTDPPGQDGRIIATDVRKPLLPVTATIGGVAADVQYAGSVPSLISGMCQVNVRIPDTLDTGTQPVEIQIGGIPSQRGVTIEVR
jgi:uncharacterized protein (TIGR03437 family)